MTKEEIASSKISKAFFQNNSWNISVKVGDNDYHIMFNGEGNESDNEILERLFTEMLSINTNVIVDNKIDKSDLKDKSPKEKK
jgi:hypothetical protein